MEVYKSAFNQLENPLDLEGMAPGEERTGEIVFVVPLINELEREYGSDVVKGFTIEYSFNGVGIRSNL